MKCLVTGGAGFIGSNLALELEKLGHDVIVLDNFSTGSRENLKGFKGKVIDGDATAYEFKEKFDAMAQTGKEILTDLKKLNFRMWVPAKSYFPVFWTIIGSLLLVCFFPLFLVGFLFNFPPFYIPVLAASKIKDPQFVSSIRFVASLLTFTLFYLTYLILFLIFISPFYYAIGAFISLFFLGLVSYEYYTFFMKNLARWRAFIYKKKENPEWTRLVTNWNELTAQISNLN